MPSGAEPSARDSPSERDRRQAFLNDLLRDVVVFPLTSDIAALAGRISGRQAGCGVAITFEDLPIGATAVYHSCKVVTENGKQFRMIPDFAVSP
jgi:predicted nucleic acid-binding protein